jgi:Ras-related protein Rab-21
MLITTQPLKLILIGDGRVGKTSIINKYINNIFNDGEEMTINSSYCERDVLFNDKKYKFSFWDTAGQEKFNSITPIYYRDAKGVLLVYDISNPHSFERVKKWIEEMKEINNEAVFNIVGNKYDLKEQTKNFKFNFIDDEIAKKLAQKNKTDLFFTSAKTGENINQCFENLMQKVFNKFVNNNSNINNNNISLIKEDENKKEDCQC